MEEVLDCLLLCAVAIDKVLAGATQDDLPSDGNLSVFLETNRRFGFVAVIEDNGDTGFGNARLAAFVNEVLEADLESDFPFLDVER